MKPKKSVKTFSIRIQGPTKDDTFRIDAWTILDAIMEAIKSFGRSYGEEIWVVKAVNVSDEREETPLHPYK